MLVRRRHDLILALLRTSGPAEVGDLSRELGVSAATIRRDLTYLHAEGMLERVRGEVRDMCARFGVPGIERES